MGGAMLAVSSAMAQEDIVTLTTPVDTFGNNNSFTLGYEFDVTTPITVIGLSVFAADPSAGLNENTPVGLWNSAEDLLASVIVPAGKVAPLTTDGFFCYADLTSPLILPDGTYYVGAEIQAKVDDFTWATNGITTIPGVTFVEDQSVASTTLAFPSDSDGLSANDAGWFGGNVVVDPATTSELSVPDAPSALVLLSGACVALGALRRKLA